VTFLPLDSPAGRGPLQLVATLGPASLDLISELARAGATSFRLNASHLEPSDLAAAIERVRRCCPDAPVLVDLQGAKMRVECREPLEFSAGTTIDFTLDPGPGVRVPHPEFFEQVRAGDTLSLDDGRLRMTVESVSRNAARARAANGGRLLHRKGINVEQHPVELAGLVARDLDACRIAAAHGVSAFAYSFMTDGREAAWVRQAVPGCAVVGKIERRTATDRVREIGGRVDATWVCRGDLGAQLGLPGMARFVAGLHPALHPTPLLMAGQVLEHLTRHRDPTRSEVCHLHDLVARGFAGIVLSDETAIGLDPAHATVVAAELLSSFLT
jgi:pyruvate kinase